MARRKRKLVIKSAPQLRALRTPLRQQMVRALLEFGECPVRELADELGREPAALYYHVHALVEAGIATETGQRACRFCGYAQFLSQIISVIQSARKPVI